MVLIVLIVKLFFYLLALFRKEHPDADAEAVAAKSAELKREWACVKAAAPRPAVEEDRPPDRRLPQDLEDFFSPVAPNGQFDPMWFTIAFTTTSRMAPSLLLDWLTKCCTCGSLRRSASSSPMAETFRMTACINTDTAVAKSIQGSAPRRIGNTTCQPWPLPAT